MSNLDVAPKADGAESASTAGLGIDSADAFAMLDKVREQLNATGLADVASVIDTAVSLIDAGIGRIGDMHRKAQIVTSVEADFDAMTWTFEIGRGVRVGAGRYALIKMPNKQVEGAEGCLQPQAPSRTGG